MDNLSLYCFVCRLFLR